MAFVQTRLGDRSYRIDCVASQHERLTRLISVVEERAAALVESGAAATAPPGEDPELRFMLLTALLVADRLARTEDALEALRADPGEVPAALLPRQARAEAVEDADLLDEAGPEATEQHASPECPETRQDETHRFEEARFQDRRDEAEREAPAELDPRYEEALAALLASAAERMDAAAEAMERI